MNAYQKAKARTREMAVDFSYNDAPMSWGEVAEICNKFEKLGRRYGLLREFRENGIC